MDREYDKTYQEKKKEGLDRMESVEDLSRSRQAWRKWVFQKGKNTERWMQKASYSNIDPINVLSSQKISQHICKAFKIQNTH